MEGRKFGFGLAAGLLFALAVVSGAGGFGASYSWIGSLSPAHQSASPATTTTYAAATTTATAVMSSTTGQPSSYNNGASNNGTGDVPQGGGSITTTTTGTSTASQKDLVVLAAVLTPLSGASKVNSIAQQPALSNAFLLIPVLAAFLVGALAYRVSNRSNRDSEDSA